MSRTVLVTGAAGFIGAALSQRLLQRGDRVVGLDNLNDYYDPNLKQARLRQIEAVAPAGAWHFERMALEDAPALMALFAEERPQVVVNLAAQAGVRYSLENPAAYIQSNLVGFGNVLEGCRHHGVENLVYASSSSVYGGNRNLPFHERQPVNHPVSLYAASKKANELMAHTYSHLYGLPATGLRFFTVYGPWGRPDMALFKFTKAILEGKPIDVYNYGDMKRDFTYVEDLVEGIRLLIDAVPVRPEDGIVPEGDSLSPVAPWRVVNIGNSEAVQLTDYIKAIEEALFTFGPGRNNDCVRAVKEARQSGSLEDNRTFSECKSVALALLDMVDGEVARLTGTEGDFGKELDSLCDAITFGVTPAVFLRVFGEAIYESGIGQTPAPMIRLPDLYVTIDQESFLDVSIHIGRLRLELSGTRPWHGRSTRKSVHGRTSGEGSPSL